MKMLLAILLSNVWMMSATRAEDSYEEWLTLSNFEAAQTVILVRVVESTFPAVADPVHDLSLHHASASVLKSWKGPFSAGSLLHIGSPGACFGSSCQPYAVQAGDELLIFTPRTQDPIVALQGWVFRAAESKSKMDLLDQTVTQQQQLHDPQTDIVRAPARQRVLVALRGCLEDSARRQDDKTFHSACFQMDTSVLRGIPRIELAAALGPPTWCQRPDTAAYVRGVGSDCAPEQTPVWSSEPASNTPAGFECQPDPSQRCMHLGWFTVAQ